MLEMFDWCSYLCHMYLIDVVQFELQLMYELCVDPITCGPVVELLRSEKYEFFSKVCFFTKFLRNFFFFTNSYFRNLIYLIFVSKLP